MFLGLYEGFPFKKGGVFEALVLMCVAVPISYFMIKNDVFEWWHTYTRSHEGWELDEWFCVFLALLVSFFILAQFRLYVIVRIHNKLRTTNYKLIEKERKNYRHKKLVSLGSMASGLAHEVNNALQPVVGLGEFVREGLAECKNDKHLAYMNTIMNGAYHARGILENVLQYSHEKTMTYESFWVRALLLHTFNFCLDVMPKGTQCMWYGLNDLEKDDERLMLRCNDTCFRQIILNLMKNASDVMGESGDIIIRVKRCWKENCLEEADPAICIEISDIGCGMDEETMQRAFEPFFTTKDISEGTGLGLASVYSLMQQHKGDVKIDSELGKGTTFTLVFPVSVTSHKTIKKITSRIPKGSKGGRREH